MTKFQSRVRAAELHLSCAERATDRQTIRMHAGAAHVSAVRALRDHSRSTTERATAARLRDAAESVIAAMATR